MSKHTNTPILRDSLVPYTCSSTDEIIHVDTSSVEVTITLPDAGSPDVNFLHELLIIDVGDNLSNNKCNLTTTPGDGTTIMGLTIATLNQDGCAWRVLLGSDRTWRLTKLGKPAESSLGGEGEAVQPIDFSQGSPGVYRLVGNLMNPDATIDTRALSNPYNNANSGLSAGNVQAAIDELSAALNSIGDGGGVDTIDFRIATNEASSVVNNGGTLSILDSLDKLIKWSHDTTTNTLIPRLDITGQTIGHVLTVTSSGPQYQPVSAGSVAMNVVSDAGAAVDFNNGAASLLSILGDGVLSTSHSAGVNGPIVTTSITAGAEGEYLRTSGGVAAWGAAPTGIFSNFIVSGDSGPAQTISDGETVSFVGGTGIDTTAGANDALQITLNAAISDLNNIPALPGSPGSYRLNYDQATDTFSWSGDAGITGAANGLSLDGLTAHLGGDLTEDTTVNTTDAFEFSIQSVKTNDTAVFTFNHDDAHLKATRTGTDNDAPILMLENQEGTQTQPIFKILGSLDNRNISNPLVLLESSNTQGILETGYFISCVGDDPSDGDQDDATNVFAVRVDGRVEMPTYGQGYTSRRGAATAMAAFDANGVLIEKDAIPDAPGADGTYTLQVVVSSGTNTYSWV